MAQESEAAHTRSWEYDLMGNSLSLSPLYVMPKIFEGNYLLDAILLSTNNPLIWKTLRACTKGAAQKPASRWEVSINRGLCGRASWH